MTTSTGKLDLANVMKLCGIMDDDDFMDTDETLLQQPPPPSQCSTPYDTPTSLNTTQQSDNDCRSNALYLEGARSIEENSRWLTIPYVQNANDLTNNRVSNSPFSILYISTQHSEKSQQKHDTIGEFIFAGFFIHHTINRWWKCFNGVLYRCHHNR